MKRTSVTPLGVRVYSASAALSSSDLDAVDRQAAGLASCLQSRGEVKRVNLCAMRVIIAPDEVTTPSGRQYFPCAPGGVAERCAGTTQPPYYAVTTPDLASLAHELEHLVTRKTHGPEPGSTAGWCAP
jgi:hypothetical protein